jgi:hypothetical protein
MTKENPPSGEKPKKNALKPERQGPGVQAARGLE